VRKASVVREVSPIATGQLPPQRVLPLTGGNLLTTEISAKNKATSCAGQVQPASTTPSDPVNPENGNYYFSKSLISIPNRGVPLSFGLTYSSLLGQKGITSPYTTDNGWALSTGVQLVTNDDEGTTTTGDVTVIQESGAEVAFSLSGSTYSPVTPRIQATLSYNSSTSTYTFTRQGTTTFTFNSSGQPLTEVDQNGNTLTYSYTSGKLTSISDGSSRSLTFGYDSNTPSHIDSITDPLGRQWQLHWNSSGDLDWIKDPLSNETSYTYDGYHDITKIVTPNNQGSGTGSTNNTYTLSSSTGTRQLTQQSDGLGDPTSFAYSGTPEVLAGGATLETDPNGNETQFTYQYGELTKKITGYGTSSAAAWNYTYNPTCGGVATATDPNGNTTTITYDSLGDVLTVTDGAGDTSTYTYPGTVTFTDEPTSVTDPSGNETYYTYDSHGNVLTTTTGYGTSVAAKTSYGYNSTGDLTSTVNPDQQTGGPDAGGSTTYGVDSYGDRLSSTTANTAETSATYDIDGDVLTTTQPLGNSSGGSHSGHVTTYAYDSDGRLCWTVQSTVSSPTCGTVPSGATSATYDADGNVKTSTQPNGNVTTNAFNVDDQECWTLAGTSANACSTVPTHATSYTYDADGNITIWQDELGNQTKYQYSDPAYPAKVTKTTQPDGTNATTTTYDADGNVQTTVDAEANTVTSYYDQAERLCFTYVGAVSSPSCGSPPSGSNSYTYYANGLRHTMTDASGTTTYTYNANNQATQVVDGNSHTVNYGYDPAGYTTCISYPVSTSQSCSSSPSSTNTVVDYTITNVGETSALADWLGQTTSYTYNYDGDITNVAYPSGTSATTTNTYTGEGSTDAMTAQAFELNADGHGSSTVTGPTYTDTLGNHDGTWNESWTYSGGLMASSTEYGTTVPNAYDGQDQATDYEGETAAYQTNGEVCWHYFDPGTGSCPTAPNGTSLSYNSDSQITSENSSGTPYATTTYTPDGQLCQLGYGTTGTSCTTSGSASYPASFGWDAYGNMCWEDNTVGSSLGCSSPPAYANTMTSNGDGLRMDTNYKPYGSAGSSATYTWDAISTPSAPRILDDSINAFIYGPTSQGMSTAPIEQISVSGGTTGFLNGDSFGVHQLFSTAGTLQADGEFLPTNPTWDWYNFVSGAVTPFGYNGLYFDSTLGLATTPHRDLNEGFTSFLSQDPLNGLTHSPYAYANNDPVNASDPSGLCGCSIASLPAWIVGAMQTPGNNLSGKSPCSPQVQAVLSDFYQSEGVVGVSLGTGLVGSGLNAGFVYLGVTEAISAESSVALAVTTTLALALV